MMSLMGLASQLNSPFSLSLPSLLKTQLGLGPSSLVEEEQYDKNRLDPRTAVLGNLSQQLPVGGYPSLLKQQLRELVLRRKSLVRLAILLIALDFIRLKPF